MLMAPSDPRIAAGTNDLSTQDVPSLLQRLQEATARLDAQREVLAGEAAPQLRHTEDRLRDVTAATETAATSIMDGVNELTGLVAQLGEMPLPSEAAPLVGQLTDGLFDLMVHLQFQDITSQQLRYAESVIRATECQLVTMAAEGTGEAAEQRTDRDAPCAFDPRASSKPLPNRQASIDALFGG
jgi:chemotaxis regulatin CheY-phosphate phosphatase CheZ